MDGIAHKLKRLARTRYDSRLGKVTVRMYRWARSPFLLDAVIAFTRERKAN